MPCPDEEKSEGKEKSDGLTNRLLKSRMILISGAIEEELGERVITQTLVLDSESHEPIRVFITSPGGMVDVGFAIHDVLRYVESEIYTIGAGFVASMGVPILLAAKKENRYALPNTRFMMHQPSTGAAGQASDIRITAQEILKIREKLNHLISEETGQPLDKIAIDSDRDFWMTADDAVEYGLITKVLHRASEIGK